MPSKAILKWFLFFTVAISFTGYSIVFPILPLLTTQRGNSILISGIIIAAYPLAQIVANPLLGYLSDRFGRKHMLLLSLCGSFLSFLVIASTNSLFLIVLARLLDGASGGIIAIAQSYMADLTTEENRTKGMGFISAAVNIGFIFGPILGGALGSIALDVPFYVAAVCTFISLLFGFIFLPKDKEKPLQKRPFKFSFLFPQNADLLSWNFIAINILIGCVLGGFFAVVSPFAIHVFRLNIFTISLIIAYTGFLTTIIRGYILPLGLKIASEKTLYMLTPLFGITGMLLLAFPLPLIFFLIGITIFSFGDSLLNPLTTGMLSRRTSPEHQGGILGTNQSGIIFGRALGTLAVSWMFTQISLYSVGIFGAIVFGTILFLVLFVPFKPLAQEIYPSSA